MAVPENKIGDFAFIEMSKPMFVKRQAELVARPGVDGVGVFRTGTRGAPFRVKTGVDVETLASGQVLFDDEYRHLIGTDPVTVIWSDIDMDATYNLKYLVLDVELIALNKIGASTGGLNAPSGAYLECGWVLVPVDVS